MDLQLKFPIESKNFPVSHGDDILLLGSCFSDSMVPHFENAGHSVISNPFGTLFHPMSLAHSIELSLSGSKEVRSMQRDDLFFAWEASGKLYGFSQNELEETILNARKELRERLGRAKLLVITFGTAWGYRHQELDYVVGNCHKADNAIFSKELSGVEEIGATWRRILGELTRLNPALKVVFTVSPVRHKKDGLIENNRSKSRLIELVHGLNGDYFPAYELAIDVLRDYRFYSPDLVHLTSQAVDYVWKAFESFVFTEETRVLNREVAKVNNLLRHKSLYAGSQNDQKRIQKALDLRNNLTLMHPGINWMEG